MSDIALIRYIELLPDKHPARVEFKALLTFVEEIALEQMECRRDEDCDHCYGVGLLHDIKTGQQVDRMELPIDGEGER